MNWQRWWLLTFLILASAFAFAAVARGQFMDPPHVAGPYCSNCHSIHGASYPTLLGQLCTDCHTAGGSATAVKTHSSLTTSATYGNWDLDCWACHEPHKQEQDRKWSTTYGKYIRDDFATSKRTGAEVKIIDPNAPGPYYPPLSIDRTVVSNVIEFTSQSEFVDGDVDSADDICQVCHVSTNYYNTGTEKNFHTNYGADSQTGGNCTACHTHNEGFAAGSCTGCHSSPTDAQNGPPTRRAVVGEFSSTSHHVAGGAVTDDDCAVCHYEAVGLHQDNKVDLRDPDTGNAITGFTQFWRDTTTDVLESWVTNVQNNFCLKCHDSDSSRGAGLGGAPGTMFSSNPLQPFSWSSRDVPDVYGQFDTANPFHHAVRGQGSNPYTIPSASNSNKITMELPWNQDATHDQISCFDCHGVPDGSGMVAAIGHGGTNQRMLRDPIDLNTMESGTLPAGMGATVETFCTRCHKASVYVTAEASGFIDSEDAGSIFEFHGDSQQQHSAAFGNELGCMGCHGGIVNLGDRPKGGGNPPPYYNGAARGNIHGGSFDWSTTTSFATGPTDYFMLGGWIGGWQISGTSGECSGGDCNHGGTNSAGQDYTR